MVLTFQIFLTGGRGTHIIVPSNEIALVSRGPGGLDKKMWAMDLHLYILYNL